MAGQVYKMCINNAKSYIKRHPAGTEGCIDAFTFSTVLAVMFCCDKERTLNDLIDITDHNLRA